MNRFTKIGKILFVLTGLLVLIASAGSDYASHEISNQTEERTPSSDEDETYIQSFDVVAQNVQSQFTNPAVYQGQVICIEQPVVSFINKTFTSATSAYFEILCEHVIAPNAP